MATKKAPAKKAAADAPGPSAPAPVVPILTKTCTLDCRAIREALNKSALLRGIAENQAREFSKSLDAVKTPEEWTVTFTIEAWPGKL